MSEVFDNMLTRRSIRKFKDEPVPEEIVAKIAEAGTWAPTGMGKQSPIIIAVTDKKMRDRISELNAGVMGGKNDPFYGAPAILIVLADRKVPTYIYDGSLVMENLMLAAHDLGIGSCWIHRAKEVFNTEEGKAILKDLGIEGDYEGIGNCILGYADCEDPQPKPRKENYVYWIK